MLLHGPIVGRSLRFCSTTAFQSETLMMKARIANVVWLHSTRTTKNWQYGRSG